MKKLLVAILALVLIAPAQVAHSESSIDEQWASTYVPAKGFHSVSVQDDMTPMAPMWRAENWERTGLKWRMCNSLEQSWCKKPDRYKFDAHLPACLNGQNADCIISLKIIKSDGTELNATFERYVFSDHPNIYKGNGKEVFRDVSYPSIWSATDNIGNKKNYLISAGLTGYYGDGQFIRGHFAQVSPVELISTFHQEPNSPYPVPIPVCDDNGCSGFNSYEGQRCVVYTQDGYCAKAQAFQEGDRLELSLTMSVGPDGWFHGRLQSPDIQISRSGKQTILKVSAQPVRVPVLFASGNYSDLPSKTQKYFDRCISRGECVYSTSIAGLGDQSRIPGPERNANVFFWPNTQEAVQAISELADFAADQSPASPSVWKMNTLDFRTREYGSSCFKSNDGLQGIVTTNATAYLDGPPRLRGGFLNYEVAGLHKDRQGEVFKGTYDLVMRSDVARCLYRLTKAPVSATITVVGEGSTDIATTVVGEKNGWLKLSAYGFTFSKKTIKVKLTQKKTTITCVSTTKPVKTRKVTAIAPKCPAGFKKA